MSKKNSAARIRRKLIKKGVLAELKRRTGRSFHDNREVEKMIEARIAQKEVEEIVRPL